jgi:hypothetical protein
LEELLTNEVIRSACTLNRHRVFEDDALTRTCDVLEADFQR